MAKYQYMILSRSKPGHEETYVTWYREQHLPDVLRQPGVVSGKLFETDLQKVYTLDAPHWQLMTLYELETDDPAATIEAIRSMSGSTEMPSTDALDKDGMIQVVGHLIAAIG